MAAADMLAMVGWGATHTHTHSTALATHWSIAGLSRGVDRCGYVALAISRAMAHDGSTQWNSAA